MADVPGILDYLRNRDFRFIPALFELHNPEELIAMTQAWVQGNRAWDWYEVERYLLARRYSIGHEVVVKRLITAAIRLRRHRAMAAAMVFTDRLVDREWERWRPRLKVRIGDVLMKVNKERPYQSYMQHYQRVNPSLKPFCAATREYLRRKVWWYFRTLAKQSPDDYANAAGFALRSYHIDDVETGIGLMQRWSLLHVAYGAHPGLRFSSRRAILRDGFTLRDIVESSQPRFPDIWRSEVGQRALLRVRNEARAPLIVDWAERLLNT